MIYDKKYYIALLDKCLNTVLGALNIKDPSFIKTSNIGYYEH